MHPKGPQCNARAQGLLPSGPTCEVPESGMVHHRSFQDALTASEELRESLETEHHVVGDFIAVFYSPDVRPVRCIDDLVPRLCRDLTSRSLSLARVTARALYSWVYTAALPCLDLLQRAVQ